MSDITLRGQKGEPLTHNEVDENFANLNSDKYEAGDNVSLGSAAFSGDLIVDTDTLFVNATNDRVGINNASPAAALDVSGITSTTDLFVTQDAVVTGSIYVDSDTLVVDAINDRVGINAISPSASLDVVGTSELNGTLTVTDNISTTVGNGDGKGITFNSSSYSAATTLDYYEEGFVTLEIADAATGGNVASVASAPCFYTRIGRMVYLTMNLSNIDTTGLTSANTLYIRNLPFTVLSGTGTAYAAVGSVENIGSAGTDVRQSFSLSFAAGTDYARLWASGEGNTADSISVGDVTSGNNKIRASVFYLAQ